MIAPRRLSTTGATLAASDNNALRCNNSDVRAGLRRSQDLFALRWCQGVCLRRHLKHRGARRRRASGRRSIDLAGEAGFSRPRAGWRLRSLNGYPCSRLRLLGSRLCSMMPGRAWSVGVGPAAGRRVLRCSRRGPSRLFLSAHANGPNRSTVGGELALRPGFSPQARLPPTACSASRGGRRGLLVLTAGPVPCFYGRYPTGPVASSLLLTRGGSAPLPLRTVPTEGWEGVKMMTRTEQNWAARRRGELARDRGSRRVSSAIDAQRRMNTRPARGTRTKADPFGPIDPRYAYLTRTHD